MGRVKNKRLLDQSVTAYKKPMNIMKEFGGSFWDTLFLFVKDNDKDFIYNFVSRLPCQTCADDMIKKLDNYNLDNKSKKEIIEILWICRQEIHDKYKDKPLEEYLSYLGIKL
tara:strand:- start:345 stop:680 length:336 start_codon:yes stop_codon:yes gene_type:complete